MVEFDMAMIQNFAVAWGMRLVAAILVLLIGSWLAKRVTTMVERLMARQNVDVTLIKFLRNIMYYALITVVLIAAAGQLGINTASFLTIIGAAGLAIGLALKDSLANFSSGVMLILFRPFNVKDWVTVAGETGQVDEITVFNTILNTPDNQRKIIPNGLITSNTITNITANPTRRIDLIVGIGYDDDIKAAEAILQGVVSQEPGALTEPPVTIAVSELAASSVNFVVRPWVKTDEYWKLRFSLTQKIKQALDEAGITIPYPQQDVHMHQVPAKGSETTSLSS
ncbi:MAG: mechanosensitive ion channel [Desulfobacterales bacterium]|nr:mechanosensitive ion channel [Deltaproteobacteria bacterium]NNK93792.1 mechanosensitive ion channel [Desulfobacterales bacterium]